jgi:hypothetical protein
LNPTADALNSLADLRHTEFPADLFFQSETLVDVNHLGTKGFMFPE